MTLEKAPKKQAPALLDLVIGRVQDALVEGLPWLDHAFGRCQRITDTHEGKARRFPAEYVGDNLYEPLLPDQNKGNFSFFDIADPIEISGEKRPGHLTAEAEYALIFWLDLDKIFGPNNDRNLEAVKDQIIRALSAARLRSGRLTISKVYEKAENVYRGFDIKEIDSQYLAHPYYAIKIEGLISNSLPC